MSTALATGLTSGSVDASLAEIETKSKDAEWSSTADIVVGPFGVLNLNTTACTEIIQPTPPVEMNASTEHDMPPTGEMHPGSVTSPLIDSLLNPGEFLHWANHFSLDSGLMGTLDYHAFNPGTSASEAGIHDPSPSHHQSEAAIHGAIEEQHEVGLMVRPRQDPSNPVPSSVDLLYDAPFLLKHFQDNVVTQMMCLLVGQKSPWSIINIPAAVLTISDLTYLGEQNLNNAKLANLYSILALSAYHLSRNPSLDSRHLPEHWERVTNETYSLAKDSIQHSLRNEVRGLGKAKYKDQLMAISAMTAFAVRIPVPLPRYLSKIQ